MLPRHLLPLQRHHHHRQRVSLQYKKKFKDEKLLKNWRPPEDREIISLLLKLIIYNLPLPRRSSPSTYFKAGSTANISNIDLRIETESLFSTGQPLMSTLLSCCNAVRGWSWQRSVIRFPLKSRSLRLVNTVREPRLSAIALSVKLSQDKFCNAGKSMRELPRILQPPRLKRSRSGKLASSCKHKWCLCGICEHKKVPVKNSVWIIAKQKVSGATLY